MVKVSGESYLCERCGTAYTTRDEAAFCESKHELLRKWSEGKVDELAVAQGLGLPTATPLERDRSLRSVRNMLGKGADTSLKAETLTGVNMREAPPVLVAVTKIFSNGAVQVPAEIRGTWGVRDGDFLFWYRQGNTLIIVSPEQAAAPHRQPHFVGPTRELPSPP